MDNDVIVRPIKRGDFEAVYGYAPARTIKGYTAELHGQPVAVAGVYYMPDHVVAFCNVSPDAQHDKRGMASGFRKFAALLNELNTPVFAIADPDIPSSEILLMRCGFKYLHKGPNGEVFVWHKH
jgi:hypothetical protein